MEEDVKFIDYFGIIFFNFYKLKDIPITPLL